MSTPVEQIKERLGIADVIGSYIKLDRAGSSYKAKCPFHNEKTPSFFVSPARNSYYCFGCQAKGDIFTFVQEFEGLDFVGALRVLALRAGVTLQKVDPKQRSEYARLYQLMEKATRFFEAQLGEGSEARQYLRARGLLDVSIRSWRLGYAPDEWRFLFDYLLREGFTPDEMLKVGLVKRPAKTAEDGSLDLAKAGSREEMEKVGLIKQARADDGSPKHGDRFYDTFRGRIMFPILDSASRVIAFSGRILQRLEDGKTGKYINSPETVLFSKSHVLHGFHLAKLAIRQKDAAILVEGQMDLLMSHQAGYQNTVASSGTALTTYQLERLRRLSENLLIAFDSDNAGLKAAERAIGLALSLGMNVKVIPLNDKDPADLILRSPDEWTKAVDGAKHVVEFLLEKIQGSGLAAREQALRIERALLPLLRMLPSRVEQSHFLKIISERTGLQSDALWETLKKLKAPVPTSEKESPKKSSPHRSLTLERRVFGLFHAAPEEARVRVESRLRELFGPTLFDERRQLYEGEKDVLLAEVEAIYGTPCVASAEEEELLRNLEEEMLCESLATAMDELALAERQGRKDHVPLILERCKNLGERLSALKAHRFQTDL